MTIIKPIYKVIIKTVQFNNERSRRKSAYLRDYFVYNNFDDVVTIMDIKFIAILDTNKT